MRLHRTIRTLVILFSCLPISLAAAGEADRAPILRNENVKAADCYPAGSAMFDYEANLTMVVIVAADGTVKGVEVPAGTPAWLQASAACVAGKLQISPAIKNGVPVEARATLPINFLMHSESGAPAPVMTPPRLRSDEATVEQAYRDCYPAGQTAAAQLEYRITVSVDGSVSRAKVISGSGNKALDRAGACVLKKLNFVPGLRGRLAVLTTTNWPLQVRPPASP